MASEVEPRFLTPAEPSPRTPAVGKPAKPDASDSALFDIYRQVIESRSGARDAEIFQKIREWCFSDFSLLPHEFAGVTEAEFKAWQLRHHINLSAGSIQPDPRELQRGYAWGHIRSAAAANHLRSEAPPPQTTA
jgi:hypothetical protein